MDSLRATLDILFNEMRPEPLLQKSGGEGHSGFLGGGNWKERFIALLLREFRHLSWDQCNLSAGMVESYYMGEATENSQMAFAPEKSVFNILLHFTGRVLSENSGAPVCKFEHTLRWSMLSATLGEDMMTCSFLASKDVFAGTPRHSFDWDLVIGQDDEALSGLFSKAMADVHMHLKGSSSNFDLSWLSLMNYPGVRQKQFESISIYKQAVMISDTGDSIVWPLSVLALKACAIRYRLYMKYVRGMEMEDREVLDQVVYAEDLAAVMLADALQIAVRTEALIRESKMESVGHDYVWPVDKKAVRNNPNCILYGERYLLYRCFYACYEGSMVSEDENLFYAYLLIKNRIRKELIQSNHEVGFHNFDDYEKRKTCFIQGYPPYEKLVEPLAIGLYFHRGMSRYVEPRITPRETSKDLGRMIERLDGRIREYSQADIDKYHYVLHFIKTEDKHSSFPVGPIEPRHCALRRKVRKQAMAIQEFRCGSSFYRRVVGIDAANSEIFARPEVFAQAFRFLRGMQPVRYDKAVPDRLGQTYHVGEDFLSPLDGLRAIDEVMHFLRFRNGDRLGHALVLGIDPMRYYKNCHAALLLPKMMVLDNIAWCLMKMEGMPDLDAVKGELHALFARVFRQVYVGYDSPSVRDYYDSWLLRGDDPEFYRDYYEKVYTGLFFDGWDSYRLNDDPDANSARQNPKAKELYYLYHFDPSVRKNGGQSMEVTCPKGMGKLVKALQDRLIDELIGREIAIETNPTSNYRIGGFERYLDIPLRKFFPESEGGRRIITSVNTDDRGVFATSIEREYAIIACALFKESEQETSSLFGMSRYDIYEWLDKLRKNAFLQRFAKGTC